MKKTEKYEIISKLRGAKPSIIHRFPIHRLSLFGSCAREDATPDSDIDILVEVDPSIGLGFVDLANYLESILGRPVDLVSRRAIRPELWSSIEPELIDV